MNELFVTTNFNHIRLHKLKTDKFKTNTVVINLAADLAEETATKIAILPHVLLRGSKNFPTYKKIKEELDLLYGASIDAFVYKRGEKQIAQFTLEVANEKYLTDNTPLLEKTIQLLGEILTNPNVENNTFEEAVVDSEKTRLENRIKGILDNKIHYAEQKMLEQMCENEKYHIPANGFLKDIKDINHENLYYFYQEWIKSAVIDIFVLGEFDVQALDKTVKSVFNTISRKETKLAPNLIDVQVEGEKLIIDELEINQGKLNIGLRTYTSIQDDDYYSLLMYNGILGGFSHSKLFVNVREKASLAYYASSRLDSHKGLLIIQTGIEINKFEQAVEIIKQQLQILKAGEISEKEQEQTKSILVSQMREITDRPRNWIDFTYHSVLSDKQRTIENVIQGIQETTIEDVIKIAEKVKLDTIYFLRDKQKEGK